MRPTSPVETVSPECDPEALDGPARAVEHARADDLELPLEILGHRSLLFKQFTQFASHREGPALAVLRFSWIEPHFAGAEIDLAPLERQDLAVDPPAGDIADHWLADAVGSRRVTTDTSVGVTIASA